MAAAGSETEVEAIFLTCHQQPGMEPGAWEVTVTSPRHTAHGVEEGSVSLQRILNDFHCHWAPWLQLLVAQVNGAAAANVTNSGLVLRRVYVPRRAESYTAIKVHSSIDSA